MTKSASVQYNFFFVEFANKKMHANNDNTTLDDMCAFIGRMSFGENVR